MKNIISVLLLLTVVISCSENDPCDFLICQNGGTCNDGKCVCAEGYTGSLCDRQKTPSKIKVTSIAVTKFPVAPPSGAGWDVSDGPDLMVVLSIENNGAAGTKLYETGYMSNVTVSPGSYSFNVNPPVELDPNVRYVIELYDYDPVDSNDWMGGISFIPYSDTNNFAEKLSVDAANSPVAFQISVTYTF